MFISFIMHIEVTGYIHQYTSYKEFVLYTQKKNEETIKLNA